MTDDSTAVVTATTTSSASKMPDTLTPDIQQVSGSNKDSTGYGAEFFTSKQLFEATWENRVDEVGIGAWDVVLVALRISVLLFLGDVCARGIRDSVVLRQKLCMMLHVTTGFR